MTRHGGGTSYELIEREGARPIKAWVRGLDLDDGARQQLENVARLPIVFRWVAAMPDVHWEMTSFGLLMMNSGAPMIGSERFASTGGNAMLKRPPRPCR